jgi:tetratricopeptide (TPR) repeat protein
MRLKEILLHLSLLISVSGYAQLNPEKAALNKIKKGEWRTAQKILKKALKKDSLNIEASYVYSVLYFSHRFYDFNVDTAHAMLNKTIRLYAQADLRSKKRLKRFPIDSAILSKLRTKIDSAAFEQAKSLNSEDAYIYFIKHYSDSRDIQMATELRDEAAFVSARKQNTHQSFQRFLHVYPNSRRAPEARQLFEKLLFESSTRNKTLRDYQNFVAANPTSPFAEPAIKEIFELSTLEGTESSFDNFIKQFPDSKYSYFAQSLLAHMLPDTSIDAVNREWIPFAENGRWGFMDETGAAMFQPILPSVHEKYFCEPMVEDFIHSDTAIIERSGRPILFGKFQQVTDLGAGFLLADIDTAKLVVHKSGWQPIEKPLTDAAIVGSRFLAIKSKVAWGLFALNGKQILDFAYDRITPSGSFLSLAKSGKEILVKLEGVIPYSKGAEAIVADEIRSLGKNYFWIRNGSLEKVLNMDLKEIIPFDRHSISLGPIGFIIKKNSDLRVQGWPSLENISFSSLTIAEPWLVTRKKNERPSLIHIPSQQEIATSTDSVWFDQGFAAMKKKDSVQVWLSLTKSFTIPSSENYDIRMAKDSTVFILIRSKSKTAVHHAGTLVRLFTAPHGEIEPIQKNIFLITDRGKHGLLNEKGKTILKPNYDAILFSSGIFSLLKGKKFGSYNPATKKLIEPSFDSNLKPYGPNWTIARKEGKLAILKSNGQKQTDFEFDDLEFWSDTVALVVQNGKRSLYSIPRKKNYVENISALQVLEADSPEHLAIFKQNGFYGVMGNSSGIVVNPEFEEISHRVVNGSLIFIAAKPVDGATLHVTYFQSNGKPMRSNLMLREMFEQMVCE